MELKPDGSLLVDNALTMSRLSSAELCPEVASLVRLTLGGDSGAFEQIIMRYETRVMGLATRLVRDFRPIVRVLVRAVDHGRQHCAVCRRVTA